MIQTVTAEHIRKSDLLKALAHPVRFRIAEGLTRCECNVDKMVKSLGLPQSTVSQHLAVLKNKGILTMRKDGVRTCYCVSDARVKRLLQALR